MEVRFHRVTRSLLGLCIAFVGFQGLSQTSYLAAIRTNALPAVRPNILPAVTNAAPSARANVTNSVPSARANVAARPRPDLPPIPVQLDNHHKIRSGDKVSFRVAEDGDEPPKTLTVTDSGEIDLGYFGRFAAEGKTCHTLGEEIKRALEKEFYHRATVYIGVDSINNVRGKVYVSGQVTKPGPVNIPVDAPLKLSQAILLAGPPLQWAKLSAVKVVRQNGRTARTTVVDVDAILNKGRLERDIVLEPDDLVIVPERGVLIGGG